MSIQQLGLGPDAERQQAEARAQDALEADKWRWLDRHVNWIVPSGIAVLLFLSDWGGYRGRTMPWGDPRPLAEVWWHFPLWLLVGMGFVRLQQWDYWRGRVKPFSGVADAPTEPLAEPEWTKDSMSLDILSLLNRVARSMESVVPGLELTAKICEPVWLEDAMGSDPGLVSPTGTGEWLNALGFDMCYRGVLLGGFQQGSSGSAPERVQAVALELMSQVQDLVAEATTEPWPLVVVDDDRRDMALAGAIIEAGVLHMWYGDHGAPVLTLPSVQLL